MFCFSVSLFNFSGNFQVIKTMRNIVINDDLTGISACQVGAPLSIIAIHVSQSMLKSLPAEVVSAEKLEPFYPQVISLNFNLIQK